MIRIPIGGVVTALASMIGLWWGASQVAAQCQPQSDPNFPTGDVDGTVWCSAVFDDDGAGPHGAALYIGGTFTHAGGVAVNRIARWDGTAWMPLGTGLNNQVTDLLVYNDGGGPALFACGTFTMAGGQAANRIAKWNGSTWSALGTGLDDAANAMRDYDDGGGDALYVTGTFLQAGGKEANRLARWKDGAWSRLTLGGIDGAGNALVVFNDGGGKALYVAGEFKHADDLPAKRIARWKGGSWKALAGGGMDSTIYTLKVYEKQLYAGGAFTKAGDADASNIAVWNGSVWSALGAGTDGAVLNLSGDGGLLYIGGQFTTIDGVPASRIASYDGATINTLGLGLNDGVRCMTRFDDGRGSKLWFGGDFTTSGGTLEVRRLARWNGAVWSDAGRGLGGDALCMGIDGQDLVVGGKFLRANGELAARIARFNGTEWSPIGAGFNSTVYAVASVANGPAQGLYAGGSFDKSGQTTVNRIARWDGAAWQAVRGTDADLPVFALLAAPEGLYLGGAFTTLDDKAINRIALWNGSKFVVLGSGMDSTVNAMTLYDDGNGSALYAAGYFTTAGGVTVNGIAKWDGAGWSALGTGLDGTADALAVFDGSLYVCGDFANAGGVSVSAVARWDGSNWFDVGGGVNGEAMALAVFDDGGGTGEALYVGGYFTTAGGFPANFIARWDGAGWDILGDNNANGAGAPVYALLAPFPSPSGPDALYAAGGFTSLAGIGSQRIGAWVGCPRICYPDCSPDGVLDLFDFLCFVNQFNAKDPYADCVPDGTLDLFDFLCFVNGFNAGC